MSRQEEQLQQQQQQSFNKNNKNNTINPQELNNNDDIDNSHLSEAIGRFQGLAIGTAYIIGIPLSHILTKIGTKRSPLYMAMSLCGLGCLLTLTCLPESLTTTSTSTATTITTKSTTTKNPHIHNRISNKIASTTAILSKLQSIDWSQANPFGAIKMLLTRNHKLALGSLVYLFINLAQTGMNVMWINYLDHRFGWSQVKAGGACK